MEVLKYIDKVKTLNYALQVAKERGIPQSKLCEGLYDPSNFYRICHAPTDANINLEKLIALLDRLNIGKSAVRLNGTIFDSRTIELMDILEEEYDSYTFDKYPLYLNELEELNPNPIVELTQYILWLYGTYEFALHHYDDASAYFMRAIDKTQPDFSYDKIERCKLDDQEIAVISGKILSEYMLKPQLVADRYLQMLLNQKPGSMELQSIIYVYRAIVMLRLHKYEDAATIVTKGMEAAKERRAIVNLPLLKYFEGVVDSKISKNNKKLEQACLLCEAYGLDVRKIDYFYNLSI